MKFGNLTLKLNIEKLMIIKMLEFHGLPKSFYVIWVGIFINALGGFVTPFLAMYLTASRGFSLELTGIISGLIGVGMFFAGPLGGNISDRIGRRKVLTFSLIFSALTLFGLVWSQSKVLIATIGLLNGLFSGMYRPVASAAIADIVDEKMLHRAYRLMYWAINIGFAVAASLAGYFATKNFQILFITDIATTIIFAIVVWFYFPNSFPNVEKSNKIDFLLPFKNPLFVKLFLHMPGFHPMQKKSPLLL